MLGRIAKVIGQGMRSVGDDAARVAFNRGKADEMARGMSTSFDDYQRNYAQAMQDLGGNPSNPYSGTKGAVYTAGRTLGKAGQTTGGIVNSMGGVPGVAMNAMFMAPMFMSMAANSDGNGYSQSPDSYAGQQLNSMPDSVNSAYQQELIYKAQLQDAKRRRKEAEDSMMASYQQSMDSYPQSFY